MAHFHPKNHEILSHPTWQGATTDYGYPAFLRSCRTDQNASQLPVLYIKARSRPIASAFEAAQRMPLPLSRRPITFLHALS